MSERSEYMTNCVDRILMAPCAPSEFRRRSVAINNAIYIAAREGLEAAHKHLQAVVAEAEAGEFAMAGEFAIRRHRNGEPIEE